MHDRKDAGTLVVVLLDFPVVRKQAAYIRRAIDEAGVSRALNTASSSPSTSILLSVLPGAIGCKSTGCRASAGHARRAPIFPVRRSANGCRTDRARYSSLNMPRIQTICGLLIFRKADQLTFQIGRSADIAVRRI